MKRNLEEVSLISRTREREKLQMSEGSGDTSSGIRQTMSDVAPTQRDIKDERQIKQESAYVNAGVGQHLLSSLEEILTEANQSNRPRHRPVVL